MASADAKADIFTTNPYDAHSGLSATEAAVLWEYAKLSQHLKDLVTTTRKLSEEPDETLLAQLRVLERKMGLVLTLYKASVWAVIHDQPVADATGSYEASADLTVRH